METFKQAKQDLRRRLADLNGTLNKHLYNNRDDIFYEEFLATHQPFHWIAEFYEIIHDRGGFDVIIGNPPYVEYNKRDKKTGKAISDYYKVNDYSTIRCANLHAFCVERSFTLLATNHIGLILHIGAFSTPNMSPLMNYVESHANLLWVSFYHFRPSRLFDGGASANIPTTIFIASSCENAERYATGIKKFTPKTREYLFNTLIYTKDNSCYRSYQPSCFPKVSSRLDNSILDKVVKNTAIGRFKQNNITTQSFSYRSAGGLYWKICVNFDFPYESISNKKCYLSDDVDANVIVAFLSSSLQWQLYCITADTLNFTDGYVFSLPLSYHKMDKECENQLSMLCEQLMDNYKKYAKHKYRGGKML